jgi:hypothetical protein
MAEAYMNIPRVVGERLQLSPAKGTVPTMPYARMAIPLRSIATGEGYVSQREIERGRKFWHT